MRWKDEIFLTLLIQHILFSERKGENRIDFFCVLNEVERGFQPYPRIMYKERKKRKEGREGGREGRRKYDS